MAKFVLIAGPQAVGKMTVGQELNKITNLKFMHNHETIELPVKLFGWTETRKKITEQFRNIIFEEFAKSDLEGLIFTILFYFDIKDDYEWFENVKNIFEENGGEVFFVELEASLDERMKRNITENRLKNKPSKQNIEISKNDMINSMEKHRLNSMPGEIKYKNYIKIDNTNLSPEKVAKIIKEKFNL